MRALRLVPLVLLSGTAHAAESQATVVRAAWLLDVRTGALRPNPVVVIEGERISAVNPAKPPEGARVVDLGQLTLLPGLIDAHTHLTYDADDFRLDLGRQPNAAAAGRALVGAKNARLTLMAGFTTVRDLGACCFADVTLKRAIERGHLDGPRMVVAAHIIASSGGNCDQTLVETGIGDGSPLEGIADGPESIARAVRLQVKYGAGVIKTCADRGQFSEAELRVMAEAAHQRRVKLAVHVHETESVLRALRAGADSIEHASVFTQEVVELMVRNGTYLVPTLYTVDDRELAKIPPGTMEKLKAEVPLYVDGFQRCLRGGVKMAFGSDSGQIPHGENAREFGTLVHFGMKPLEAVRAATLGAAALLGVDDRGSIEAGRLADMIAVAGNPIEDVRTLQDVAWVMKGGRVHKRP